MENKETNDDKYGQILEGHDNDGIKEYNNNMPFWLTAILVGSVVFGLVYVLYYHFLGGPTQIDEYKAEIAAAEAKFNLAHENDAILVIPTDDASIGEGKALYAKSCIACHGAVGEGAPIGPNLTDKYWKNGGSDEDIYKVISDGIPNTAMMAWKTQMSPKNIAAVTAYIKSIQGSNPEGAKAPEGELVE